ncbi:MAG: RnfABCDGE type electron transport complex subunit G [Clostridia bacterium]|nr:RnfABCDGE type electron transport complex subunit G [Clostridia bacterium]
MAEKQSFFKENWSSIFKPVIVLLSICIIIPLALALTNAVTKGPIEKQEETQRKASMQELFPDCTFEDKGNYTIAESDGNAAGYIFNTSSDKGYGGEVKIMTAILPDGNIKAVKILSVDNETPGLGQNAAKESFYGQFAGKATEKLAITKDGGEIVPVTGASITSRAVTEAVNKAIEIYNTEVKEEG